MSKPRMVTRNHGFGQSGPASTIETPVVSDLPVRLYLGEGMDEYLDVSPRKSEDGRWRLYVNGGRRIIIHPQVANAVEIEVEDYARRKKS
jgi:hypothetical protein